MLSDSGGWGYAPRSLSPGGSKSQFRIRKIERFPKDDLVMAFALRGLESRKFLPTSSVGRPIMAAAAFKAASTR
jgi:hypothetical protein